MFAACSVFLPQQGAEGQPCTDGGLCLDGLTCTPQGMCVSNYTPDGDEDLKDVEPDPDTDTDQDLIPDGDADDDSIPDGDDDLEPDADEDSVAEADPEADEDITTDTDPDTDPDVDEDIEPEPDPEVICTSHEYFACYGGDIYWYDSCNQREEKKEECDNCGCLGDACVVDNEYSFRCDDNNVYWYDCRGNRAAMKEDCGVNACAGSICQACDGGVCTDAVTGLEWQQVSPEDGFKWDVAQTHCENLDLDGGGWRLPNISELRSLIRNCAPIEGGGACGVQDECSVCEVSAGEACLETACGEAVNCNPASCNDSGGPTGCYWSEVFNEEVCNWYWSSSLVADNNNKAWYVRFNFAEVVAEYTTWSLLVRCVRDGGT